MSTPTNFKSTYESKVLNAKVSGKTLPSFEEIVLCCLGDEPKQLQDIVRDVEELISFALGSETNMVNNDSVRQAVSIQLKKSEAKGDVKNDSHGLWSSNEDN